MTRTEIIGRRMVGLFLLGMSIFNFPVLSLFDRSVLVFGIPVLFLYLFSAWILFIFLMLIISLSNPHTLFSDRRR